jgi:predicted DNA-binding transcriptional regulator AlpA
MSNPIAELIAEALVTALTRDEVITALRGIVATPATPREPEGLLAKPRAAKALGVSVSTLDRLVKEGAPVHHVGARRMFDIAELRAWLSARGRKPTTPKPSDRVDVSDVLARSGLRAAGSR